MTECPFRVGQTVVWRPTSLKDIGSQVMVENLTIGASYVISEIVDGTYLKFEGVYSAGGGLHWQSGFVAA